MAKKTSTKKPSGKKPVAAPGADPELRYEDLVDRLEELVEQIESGELDLEQSIRGYEEGTALIKRARAILDRAEQRVAAIEPDDEDNNQDNRETAPNADPGDESSE